MTFLVPPRPGEARSVDSRTASVMAWAVGTIVLLGIAWQYVPFVADDALISYRYSDRLLAGQGLTYTDGEWVEGYSNLLWVLLVAAGGLLTSDLIFVGRVLGSICGAAALAAVVYARPIASWRTVSPMMGAPTIAGLMTLALSHGLAIWAIGGLEQALQSALLAWALALVVRDELRVDRAPHAVGESRVPERASDSLAAASEGDRQGGSSFAPAVVLALLVLTRPDGALFCALVVAGLIIAEGLSARTLRRVAPLVAIPAIAWAGQLAFRLWYYGEWLPNTAHVKLSPSAQHALDGLRYIGGSLMTHAPIVALAIVGLACVRPLAALRRRDVVVPLVVALGWTAYVVAIGGDIFPGRRHFLPTLVCLAFVVMATWRAWLGRWAWGIQAAALIIAASSYLALQRTDTDNDRARTERWEWDCEVLASTLREAFATARPLVAADAVGCAGYFGKLPTLDLLGLNDHHIARSVRPGLGVGFVGHERGDGRYVLSRQPDILILCSATGATAGCFPSGAELTALPEFPRLYRLIPVVNRRYLGQMLVFARVDSPRIGVTRSDREIRIPGFLFAGPHAGPNARIARPAADGRLVALVPTQDVVSFDLSTNQADGALPAGPWRARADASSPVDVTIEGGVVRVTGGLEQSELREVVLTR